MIMTSALMILSLILTLNSERTKRNIFYICWNLLKIFHISHWNKSEPREIPHYKKEYFPTLKKNNGQIKNKCCIIWKEVLLYLTETRVFYNADDISSILSVSRPTAYRIIKRLNDELLKSGFIVVSGRVPKKFFDEKFYC